MSETIEYKGYNIVIEEDTNPQSPREWDNLGKDVWGFRILQTRKCKTCGCESPKEIDSVYGYFGKHIAIEEAKGIIDYLDPEQEKILAL